MFIGCVLMVNHQIGTQISCTSLFEKRFKEKPDQLELQGNIRFDVHGMCPMEIGEVAEGGQSKMM
jgi:hypothetical protein